MREELLRSGRLFVDETRAPVLDPGRGRTKTAYFWALARDDRGCNGSDPPAVVYSHAPGRGADHAIALLKGFAGILQTDGYGAYKTLVEADRARGAIIALAHCWAQTIRTQSGIGRYGGSGRAISWAGVTQRDDMADLQRVFMDDDALDDELQDSLALAEVGILEP